MNRVLAEHKEKVSTDYKILKHVACKGEKPQLMTVKIKDATNQLIGNMDISKAESKLQKDIMKQRQEAIDKENEAKVVAEQKPKAPEDDEDSPEEVEQRPTGIVQPKYKVVHTFPFDMMDTWEGHKGSAEEGVL